MPRLTRPWYDRRMGEFPAYVQVIVASLLVIATAAWLAFAVCAAWGFTDRMTQTSEIHCSTTTSGDTH